MLNTTPLGVMLEEVAAQLLDKLLSNSPNRKLTGAELVTLIKTATKKGWVLAIHGTDKPESPVVGTLVLRGDGRQGRPAAVEPADGHDDGDGQAQDRAEGGASAGAPLQRAPARRSGVWWPEKDDLVLGLTDASDADAVIAALDGKTPSAADHAVLKRALQARGNVRAADDGAWSTPPRSPPSPRTRWRSSSVSVKARGSDAAGLSLGFRRRRAHERDASGGPAPRKPALAVFDQPALDTKQLIPLPEGVDSFMVMSVSAREGHRRADAGRASRRR